MRLVHFSDLHLGFRQFQRQTPAGINQREADVAAVFRALIDKVVSLRPAPDVVIVAGDLFHHVRPSNPAILHAFTQFSRLVQELPDAVIVMVAGNHDTPRTAETGCILRLFAQLGINVVDGSEAKTLAFPERSLSILAVPHFAPLPALKPSEGFEYNILVMHKVDDAKFPAPPEADGAVMRISLDDLEAPRWSYVALGHYHVFRQVAANAFYCGALEYTSSNIWGEQQEERAAKIGGKGFIEFDLDTGRRVFHHLRAARDLVDLPVIKAAGLVAADIDEIIRAHVDRVPGGIDDKIVRQVVRDVPRHVVRELDQKALREYKRRALHFQLDTRRPEIVRHAASGAAGRRASLEETVRDMLRSRVLPPDVDREALVELGIRYLREAASMEHDALAASSGTS